ncbi:MAG TPA: signal peptidase I [Candidatus Babeliales bacterium]|nr:signal peptidase I [Candidatus Babeliales bacterium]
MAQQHKPKQQSLLSNIMEFVFLLIIVFLIRTIGFGLYQVPTGSMERTMLVGERFFADKFSYNFRKPRRSEIIAFNDPEFKYSSNPFMKLFQRYVWGPSNWTKRVIGIPGDTIRGTIEDGKPVIYCNDIKLDEPYINKYPLIHVLRQDINDLRKQIEKDIQEMSRGYRIDQSAADRYIQQRLRHETTWRSYDSSVAYNKQPFYDLHENRIIRDEQGNPELLIPGTPIEARSGKTSPDIFSIKLGAGQYWGMGDNRLGSHDSRFFGPIKEEEIHGRIVFRIWSVDSDESWWIVDLIKHPINFWSRVRWSRFFQIMN